MALITVSYPKSDGQTITSADYNQIVAAIQSGTYHIATAGIHAGTGTSHSSAIVDFSGSTRVFQLPVMSTTQRNAISIPAEGLFIYNSSTNQPEYHNGTSWVQFGATDAKLFLGQTATTTPASGRPIQRTNGRLKANYNADSSSVITKSIWDTYIKPNKTFVDIFGTTVFIKSGITY